MTYTGYLASHTDLIIEGHRQGLPPVVIAEHLFQLGVRAQSSERDVIPSDEQHVRNLRAMVLYTLIRLGLRQRIPRARRTITLRANSMETPPFSES